MSNYAASRCRGAHPNRRSGRRLQTVALLHVSCGDRDVIEEAEAHGPPGFGMVSWVDARHKNMLHLTGQELHPLQPVPHRRPDEAAVKESGDMEVSASSDTRHCGAILLREGATP